MVDDAVPMIAAVVVVGLIMWFVTGSPIVLLPCLLAAWAVLMVARGLGGLK